MQAREIVLGGRWRMGDSVRVGVQGGMHEVRSTHNMQTNRSRICRRTFPALGLRKGDAVLRTLLRDIHSVYHIMLFEGGNLGSLRRSSLISSTGCRPIVESLEIISFVPFSITPRYQRCQNIRARPGKDLKHDLTVRPCKLALSHRMEDHFSN